MVDSTGSCWQTATLPREGTKNKPSTVNSSTLMVLILVPSHAMPFGPYLTNPKYTTGSRLRRLYPGPRCGNREQKKKRCLACTDRGPPSASAYKPDRRRRGQGYESNWGASRDGVSANHGPFLGVFLYFSVVFLDSWMWATEPKREVCTVRRKHDPPRFFSFLFCINPCPCL